MTPSLAPRLLAALVGWATVLAAAAAVQTVGVGAAPPPLIPAAAAARPARHPSAAAVPRSSSAAAPGQAAGAYVLDAVWPVEGGEPLAVAAAPDGGSYTVVLPRRTESDFRALVRRAPDGTVLWRRVVRDADGNELRPVAVAAGPGEDVFVSTDRLLLRLAGDGTPLWSAPAGDGHPDFGPAARSLVRSGDDLYGVDLANARLLGYRTGTGALRVRLGTPGGAPGSYLAPVDVAVLANGDLLVAEHGNRRLQRLDAVGNPLARWPLPARPRAVAAAGTTVLALLEDETLRVLDDSGAELGRWGGLGRAAGRFQLAWDVVTLADGRVVVADRANARLQVFRPAVAGETPAPGASASPVPSPPVTPTDPPPAPLQRTACPGEPATVALDVALSSAPPRADVLLLLDTTGSTESLLSTVRERVADLSAGLSGASADLAVGLMDVRDYPYGRAGLATDWPWLLRAPLSTDAADLAAAAADLWPGGGGDAPEAYGGALIAALEEDRVGWRPGARRFVVLLGDAVPRDTDLNAEIANPPLPGAWTPGQPSWWRDSGRDWAPGTADDLRWLDVLDRLRGNRVTLLVGVTGVAPVELAGNPGALQRYWSAWAGRAGAGGTAVLLPELSRLPEQVAALVAGAGHQVSRLSAGVEPAEQASWVTFSPPAYDSLDVPPEGLVRRFEARIEPPPDTPDGTYSLTLFADGDGARYEHLAVDLAWRASCAIPPTAVPATATPEPTSTALPSATPSPTREPTTTPTSTATPRPKVPVLLPLAMKGHCLGPSLVASDIVLVLDASSSMLAEGKLDAALAAAGTFVDLVDTRWDRLALVTFHQQARLAATLTSERSRIKSALALVTTGEGTRLDAGLGTALEELGGPRRRPTARPVLILLTDGRPDAGTEVALEAAIRRAQIGGVLVFSIGLGSDLDADLLRRIAGDGSRYFAAPTKHDLAAIYRRIAEVLPCGG